MFAYKCCHLSSETYSRGGRWEVMSYSDTEEHSIFTLIAVPIIIITFISTAGMKEKELMVIISIEAVNVRHEPCVNRLWGVIKRT